MRLIFVRHAEAAGDPHATPPRPVTGFLSPLGERQAAATAAALAALAAQKLDRVLCSPYGRCLQTAEAIVARTPAAIDVHDWLREWLPNPELKAAPSTKFEEMVRRDADRYSEECWKTELGEGCYDMHARIVPPLYAALGDLGIRRRLGGWVADDGAQERVVAIVAHGGSLGVALGAVLGLPPFPVGALSFKLAGVAVVDFALRRGIGYAQLVVPAPA